MCGFKKKKLTLGFLLFTFFWFTVDDVYVAENSVQGCPGCQVCGKVWMHFLQEDNGEEPALCPVPTNYREVQ